VSRLDRYLLSQFLVLFGFFSLVLVAVYWVNRAVSLFDQLIGDGQSALVFLEFTALTLPNVIRLVLPIAAFAAAVYVTNRLTRDSELVVMQATGFSPFRLARPVLVFGLIVTAMSVVLMNVVVPASRSTLAQRSAEIEANVTARFLREGRFLHPSPGVTIYIGEIAPTGELVDLFISDSRSAERHVTYSALRALALRSETGPKVLMFDGTAQTLSVPERTLAVTRFADLTYDLGGFMASGGRGRPSLDELPTSDLVFPTEARRAETASTFAQMRYEGHSRLARPLLGLGAALIGFSTLLVGAFSRFGLWRQVLGAVLLLMLVQFVDNLAATEGMRNERAWPLAYLAPAIGIALPAVLLWLPARQRRVSPVSLAGGAAA
jgi:lipopolysaccharide export system permease protein